jgi:hypothetical protein
VHAAEAIWAAEYGGAQGDAERVRRLRIGTARLAELRRAGDPHWQPFSRALLRHARLLDRLGLTAAELLGDPGVRDAARWTVRRLPLALATAAAWIGAALFWPPWRLTGVLAETMKPDANVRSTTRLLVGVPTYTLWVLFLTAATALAAGVPAGAAALLLLPPFGVASLWVREQGRASGRDVRRFLLKRSRRRLVAELRLRQQRLAAGIAEVVAGGSVAADP